ncbi:MAG: hypothetical protein AAF628_17310 [Planctomycetota bacterium]
MELPELQGQVLVIVSHYDARPAQPLVDLLDGLRRVPAGWPFAVRVVVNQAGERPTDAAALSGCEVLHRPNAGYNLGAWEHGWRATPAYGAYLFLQDECTVRRPGWLGALVRAAAEPGVGLVGERISPPWDAAWSVLERRFRGHMLPEHEIDGRPAERLACYRDFFARHGIDAGQRGDHLQSLVWFARREVLAAIGGFPPARNYGEAIAAEIGTSKLVQAHGWSIRQAAERPFHWFSHPQWEERAAQHAKMEWSSKTARQEG